MDKIPEELNLDQIINAIQPAVDAALARVEHLDRPILAPDQASLKTLPVGAEIASLIDHTLLKTEYTHEDVDRVCDEALAYGFASVCVNPIYVSRVARRLQGSEVKPASVVGFTLGAEFPGIKVSQTRQLIESGVRELDMVIAVGMLRSGEYESVIRDVLGVVQVCHSADVIIKVIIETGLLNLKDKVAATLIVLGVGADYVKTCTGFAPGEATAEDIRLLRKIAQDDIGVKAAAGVRSAHKAFEMLTAGASRIGATQSVVIAEQACQ